VVMASGVERRLVNVWCLRCPVLVL
jgi:hypothetical protein